MSVGAAIPTTLGKKLKLRAAAKIGGIIAAIVGLLLAWQFVSAGLRGGAIDWEVVEKNKRNGLNHILATEIGSDTGSLSSYYTDPFYGRAMSEDTIKTTSWGITVLSREGETLWVSVSNGTRNYVLLFLCCLAPVLLARDWRRPRLQVACHACSVVVSGGVCAWVLLTVLKLTIYYA
ncbi:hypothetical protein [Haloferula sp.]|uniref:hypothetical protein n=1 Tax=Haloferula sp. TaxID=2497595 RepID=UPI00329F309D